MRISPDDLLHDPLEIDQVIPADAIDYSLDLRQVGPLRVRGTAERIEEHWGAREIIADIRLRANVEGDFEMFCARCTATIPTHVAESFDLIFRPSGIDAELGERSISEAETEIGYYEESGLSLEDAVREQVLFALPERALCREDCKGLCAHCGGNRNERDCDCGIEVSDPRWSALQGFSAK